MAKKSVFGKRLVVLVACLILILTLMVGVAAGTLTAKILLNIGIEYSVTDDLSTKEAPIRKSRGVSLTDGTGANQADTVFQDNRSIADGANETIDLHDGSLSNDFGTALTLDILKVLYIKNNSTEANLLIGAAAGTQLGLFADGVSDKLSLPPGGEFLYIAPDATGLDTTTNADLKFEHDGTGSSALTYDIIAVGVD